MVNKLFGWVRIARCAEGSGGGPKIGQKGSKSWDHVTFQRRLQNDATRRETRRRMGKDLSAWVARWADRTGCQVAVPNTGSRWVGAKKMLYERL